jgi:glycogen debranching enzyme
VRANGGSRRARQRAKEFLAPLLDHLSDAGLGHISEIVDAASPHEPRGCVAQAWSVAEILRAAVEDVFGVKPAKLSNGVQTAVG